MGETAPAAGTMKEKPGTTVARRRNRRTKLLTEIDKRLVEKNSNNFDSAVALP